MMRLEVTSRTFTNIESLVRNEGKGRNARLSLALKGEKGNEFIDRFLSEIVDVIDTNLNPSRSMTSPMYSMFSELVKEKYPDLTFGDFHVWSRKVISGDYGEAYENLSVQKLMMWLKQYYDDRLLEIRRVKKDIEREKRLAEESTPADPEWVKEMSEATRKVLQKNKKKMKEREDLLAKAGTFAGFCEVHGLDEDEFFNELVDRFDKEHGNKYPIQEVYELAFNDYKRAYMDKWNKEYFSKLK